MTNISGRWMASHNGSGHWSIVQLTGNTAELILNVTPVGYAGDLGQAADLPTLTTVDVPDLIKMLNHAVYGIQSAGWGEGKPIEDLVAQAEAILAETPSWGEMFPNGRTIFYEGNDPDGFAETIKAEFGFDVAQCPPHHLITGKPIPENTWNEKDGWSFHCPPEHLDAIYASGRWPMGS